MEEKKIKRSGGARPGAGRKRAEDLGIEKIKTYAVYLLPSEVAAIEKKHESLTQALKHIAKKIK